jgi:hypothetical protein
MQAFVEISRQSATAGKSSLPRTVEMPLERDLFMGVAATINRYFAWS